MCRLFAFRSVFESQVHNSLLNAQNALYQQAPRHPDGWGVAYYVDRVPHIIRSPCSAMEDQIFKKISGVVSSKTLLAHLRKATVGSHSVMNLHPFQFGPWVFAHNGHLKNFDNYRAFLLNQISPKLRPFVLGETDSEVFFFLMLSYLFDELDPKKRNQNIVSIQTLEAAIIKSLKLLFSTVGPVAAHPSQNSKDNYYTFIITNGELILGYNGGQPLYYTTHKNCCPIRDSCAYYAKNCETFSVTGSKINHILMSSEPIQGENVWQKLPVGSRVSLDASMRLDIKSLLVV